MKVSILGGSGYVGGELLRLLLRHPEVEIDRVVSHSMAGKPVGRAHPNLRKATPLTFSPPEAWRPVDVTFVASAHGGSMGITPQLLDAGGKVIDLTADFRLKDPALYPVYYHTDHPRPDLLAEAVYGLPERHRSEIRTARLIANPGCMAAASILALGPLVAAGLVDPDRPVVVDAKSGSSASGRDGGPASLHPERSGVMRLYAPSGHRHTAEIEQETGRAIALSCHGVEAVRGVLATVHATARAPVDEKALWRAFRAAYTEEPFVRIVHDTDGLYREPEPKLLAGTNYCDVGFAIDPHAGRIVAVGALDNLMKGAAGNAVQCLNILGGWPETTALDFLGLHPI